MNRKLAEPSHGSKSAPRLTCSRNKNNNQSNNIVKMADAVRGFFSSKRNLFVVVTHALPAQRAAALSQCESGSQQLGSSPRCGSHGLLRTWRRSCTSTSAWYLRMSQNFSVPLQVLYNSSSAEHTLCRSADTFRIIAVAGYTSQYWPVPFAAL